MGPVINAAQRERCERYVALAEEHGGKVAFGGGRPAGVRRAATTSSRRCSTCPTTPTRRRRTRSSARCSASSATAISTTRCASPTTAPTACPAQVYGADVAAATAVARRLRTGAVNVNTAVFSAYAPERRLQAERPRPRARARRHPRVPGGQAHGDRRAANDRDHDDHNLDWLISVDDHILEPPNVWVDRVAAKDRDRAPHMETDRRRLEYWVYDGKRYPSSGLSAVVGKSKEEFSPEPLPYSEMRPGCYDPKARIEDMDRAGILASLCFPTHHAVLRPAVHGGQRPRVRARVPQGLQRLADRGVVREPRPAATSR